MSVKLKSCELGRPTGNHKDGLNLNNLNRTEKTDEICDAPCISKCLKEKIKFKDGGYAWIVLGAMFTSNVLSTGYVKSFGIIYNAILDVYPETSPVMSGVMMGLLVGCKTMFAPLVGAITNVIGARRTMTIGCTFYVAALISSCFCTSPSQLAFTLGALTGLSQCVIDTCQVLVLPQFFESKLSLANGIRVAGNPCGGIVLPALFTALHEAYGLKLMFILIAGVMSHIYICSCLMRPINIHVKIKTLDYIHSLERSCPYDEANDLQIVPSSFDKDHKRELYHSILSQNADFSKGKKKKPLELKMLKNSMYILFLLMAAMFPLGVPLVTFYITIYAKTVVGLTGYEISFMLAFQSAIDFLLRIFMGWLNNKNLYKLSNGFAVCMWISALVSVMVPLTGSLWSLMLLLATYSIGPTSFHTFITVMLCHEFGKESIATTWGFLRMVQGVFSFIHPALIGFVLEKTGSYTAPFLLMGAGLFLCGLFIFLDCVVIKLTHPSSLASS